MFARLQIENVDQPVVTTAHHDVSTFGKVYVSDATILVVAANVVHSNSRVVMVVP